MVAAQPDASAMPRLPNTSASSGGTPGTASRVPTIAVNTINATTGAQNGRAVLAGTGGIGDTHARAVEAATKDLSEKLAAAETKIADVKAAAFAKSEAPERKTISPAIQKLLAKAGADAPEDGQFTVSQVEALIAKANISDPVERLALKRAAGL